jgi:hypothetical protein
MWEANQKECSGPQREKKLFLMVANNAWFQQGI